ncbi:hypothetical protein OG21DRAFT_1518389 [Imleria badia]|nr:hypothetical protein OG21DRAFT_1518389 [Imleria badia]
MHFGLIVASEGAEPSDNLKWKIINRGGGGNQVAIENVLHPGAFANVPNEEVGAPLVGSNKDRLWTLVKVDHGKFAIQTEDGRYVWDLPQGKVNETIVLRHHSGRENQKWSFEMQLE